MTTVLALTDVDETVDDTLENRIRRHPGTFRVLSGDRRLVVFVGKPRRGVVK